VQLAAKGANVILVARSVKKLEAAFEEVKVGKMITVDDGTQPLIK
jgi:short-subunit dehydrogenase